MSDRFMARPLTRAATAAKRLGGDFVPGRARRRLPRGKIGWPDLPRKLPAMLSNKRRVGAEIRIRCSFYVLELHIGNGGPRKIFFCSNAPGVQKAPASEAAPQPTTPGPPFFPHPVMKAPLTCRLEAWTCSTVVTSHQTEFTCDQTWASPWPSSVILR